MYGSKSLRSIGAAILFACLTPLACAVDADAEYAAGLDAAQGLHYGDALEYFTRAAAHGNRDAMRTAGLMMLYGEALYGQEVHKDWIVAIHLLAEAANRGCTVSAFILQQVARHHLG